MVNKDVDVIERPLIKALNAYYSDKMKEDVTARYGNGLSAEDLKLLQDAVENDGRVFEDVYFEETELKRLLGVVSSDAGSTTQGAASKAANSAESKKAEADKDSVTPDEPGIPDLSRMVKTRIWKSAGYKIQSIGTTEPFISWMKVDNRTSDMGLFFNSGIKLTLKGTFSTFFD